jgi:hypothetical protein
MKKKRGRRQQHCAPKLDLTKAYDRVEWNYLQAIMEKMGFHRIWIVMIMRLVTSVSFLVLLDGAPLEKFKPSRGIHQGDPISPYVFFVGSRGPIVPLKIKKSIMRATRFKGIIISYDG